MGKKLSLASNRVKRLKDDAPDTAGNTVSYFPALREIDLSCNEISSCSSLPVIHHFQSLRTIRLSDNPCVRDQAAADVDESWHGISIIAETTEPWYLKGNGSFRKRQKITEPKVKLNRKRMKN